MENESLKEDVREFWDAGSCGEVYAKDGSEADYYESQSRKRYELEPYIHDFAKFGEAAGRDILEIGVGMGADHAEWAKSQPKSLTGIDLTDRAIEHTRKRMDAFGLQSELKTGDAENLSFDNDQFDIVYSWGVLHHSPNTPKAIEEVHRVLKKGGVARVMIYQKNCIAGYMLWLRYGLMAGQPFRSLTDIYANHLESPGTKAYTQDEARKMFHAFSKVTISNELSVGDLLEGEAGQRHQGLILNIARKIWPRPLIKVLFKNHGLFMMIEAVK